MVRRVYYTKAPKYYAEQTYYTTTTAAPVYYTKAPKYYAEPTYYTTTTAAPVYYTKAPKYHAEPTYYTPPERGGGINKRKRFLPLCCPANCSGNSASSSSSLPGPWGDPAARRQLAEEWGDRRATWSSGYVFAVFHK